MGPTHNGNRLTKQSIYKIIKKYVRKAGLDDRIHPHSFRHFFGTYSYKENTKLPVIRAQMGHARLDTTERYIHIAEAIDSKSVHLRATATWKAPAQLKGFINIVKEIQRRGLIDKGNDTLNN